VDTGAFTTRPVPNKEQIAIPIIETTRKNGPFIKAEKPESEIETGFQPVHSKYIHNVLKRKLTHDPTFGVYQSDTNGSFKIGRLSLTYNDNSVFVDGRKYNATQGLWELLTKARPDINMATTQDKHAYKQILIQSNVHRDNYSPTCKIKANKGVKYTRTISRLFTDKMSLGTIYYDPKHPAGFSSVAKLVRRAKSNKKNVEEWLSGDDTYLT
jgi:hypothetical protein